MEGVDLSRLRLRHVVPPAAPSARVSHYVTRAQRKAEVLIVIMVEATR